MPENHHDEDQTQSFVPLAKGTEVGHYKIISKIGAGGMGEVYLAEDTKLNRKVALKFMPAHIAGNADMRARFTREAQAAAKLDHPNIVPIHEVGEYQGRPYFAMAHIEGKSLREVIKEGKLGADDAIDLTKQILEGLHRAHESGVVHRDIKPGNIIIDKDGRARLVDFGLAMVAGEDKLTKTGSTLGTVGYMSPEQVEGKACDHRSDLFSVGVILYEMLTGRRPFEGDNEAAIARAITDSVPEPVARYKSGTTGELQQIIDRALSKDSSLRYQHADGMLADLKRLQISAAGLGASRKFDRKIRRIAFFAALMTVALIILVLKPWRLGFHSADEAARSCNHIAVMYFRNLADPTDSLYLGEIATNLLITDLSESDYLTVVSSHRLIDILNTFGIDGSIIPPDIAMQVARKSRAAWLITGSILRFIPNLVLTVQVVETHTGTLLASRQFTGTDNEDIFSIVDKITVKIKKDLNVPIDVSTDSDKRISNITTHSTDAYRNYIQGMRYYLGLNYVAAKRSFLKALEYDSSFALAYYGLSLGWVHENRKAMISKAMTYIDQVSRYERLLILKQEALVSYNYDSALTVVKEIIRNYPEEIECYHEIGDILGSLQNNYKDAIEFELMALELDPDYAPPYNNLAYFYDYIGDFEKSEWAINKYLELAPGEFNPLDTRAELYGRRGNLGLAIEYYNKATDINPESYFTQLYKGHMYLFNRDYQEADLCYKRVAAEGNRSMQSLAGLYRPYIPINQGKFREALIMLDESLTADKLVQYRQTWHEDKYRLKAWLNHILGDHGKACEFAILAFQDHLDEELKEIHWYCDGDFVFLLAQNGMADKADNVIKFHEHILDINSSKENYAAHLKSKGMLAMARKDYGKAVELLESSLDSMGIIQHDFGTPFFLALAYYRNGQLAESVELFEKIMKVYEFNRALYSFLSIEAHYWLGRAYEESGWTNKAIEQYETFLDIWKTADDGIESVDDAKKRLANLRAVI